MFSTRNEYIRRGTENGRAHIIWSVPLITSAKPMEYRRRSQAWLSLHSTSSLVCKQLGNKDNDYSLEPVLFVTKPSMYEVYWSNYPLERQKSLSKLEPKLRFVNAPEENPTRPNDSISIYTGHFFFIIPTFKGFQISDLL